MAREYGNPSHDDRHHDGHGDARQWLDVISYPQHPAETEFMCRFEPIAVAIWIALATREPWTRDQDGVMWLHVYELGQRVDGRII